MMYLAFMQDTLRLPRRTKRSVTAGRERQGSRSLGPRTIRYALQMSKDQQDFADVLDLAISRWFESAEDFARQTGISASSVSRWSARQSVPSARMIEKIAPYLRVPANKLLALAYPGLSHTSPQVTITEKPVHPLAREIGRMLDEGSQLTDEQRDTITRLIDAVLAPYRRLMRARKSA